MSRNSTKVPTKVCRRGGESEMAGEILGAVGGVGTTKNIPERDSVELTSLTRLGLTHFTTVQRERTRKRGSEGGAGERRLDGRTYGTVR